MNKIDIFLRLPPGTLYNVLVNKDHALEAIVQDKLYLHGIKVTHDLDIAEETNHAWEELCLKSGYGNSRSTCNQT